MRSIDRYELEILKECAGVKPARPWGAAPTAALEALEGGPYLREGRLTEDGWRVVAAAVNSERAR